MSAATRCGPTWTRRRSSAAAVHAGAEAIYPGLRLPVREPGARPGLRRGGHHVHRSDQRGAAAHRQQGERGRGRARPPACRSSATSHRLATSTRSVPRPRQPDVPGLRQGRCRRRWPRDAAGGHAGDAAAFRRGGDARGGRRVRRPDRVRRGGGHRPAAHRGPDPRRRRGQRHPPLRARLLAAAAAPEGRGDRTRAQPRPSLRERICADAVAFATGRSATRTPARSSSWSAPTGATSSSR